MPGAAAAPRAMGRRHRARRRADAATAAAVPPSGEFGNRRVIYFAFDSDEIRPEDQALIAAHAQWLASNPGARVRLEGHTDERGTREYNIGLGERRAQAVRRALALQGGAETQVDRPSATARSGRPWRATPRKPSARTVASKSSTATEAGGSGRHASRVLVASP